MLDPQTLRGHLLYLKLRDLREICSSLGIHTGLKMFMVEGIVNYVEHGTVLAKDVIPEISRGKKSELRKDALILYGGYKNDRKTREFFKTIIGPHFHYTAYGIDYIKARWLVGDPTTYGEFAEWWSAEYERRKIAKPDPKNEWCYIQFCQNNPGLSKKELNDAWQREYEQHKAIVKCFLDEYVNK